MDRNEGGQFDQRNFVIDDEPFARFPPNQTQYFSREAQRSFGQRASPRASNTKRMPVSPLVQLASGWFLMPRKWMKWSCFKPEPFTEREAYVWSMEKAAFKPHPQWFNGSQYHVNRGEFVTSQHGMAQEFDWTEKKVRNFTDRMVVHGFWAKRGAYKGKTAPTIIIVCNYEEYQHPSRATFGAE